MDYPTTRKYRRVWAIWNFITISCDADKYCNLKNNLLLTFFLDNCVTVTAQAQILFSKNIKNRLHMMPLISKRVIYITEMHSICI